MIKKNPKDYLIVGLDFNNTKIAECFINKIDNYVKIYKIGYQLFIAGGLSFAKELADSGKKIFLDLKLLDIDNTIIKTIESVLHSGISMLSIHAYPKVMESAINVSKGSDLCLLGVTVLTSMNQDDLIDAGYEKDIISLIIHRAKQAKFYGIGGIVTSANEAKIIRKIIGNDMLIVTPGIRNKYNYICDHKRIMTPKDAIKEGASHIVIARPIIQAKDPINAIINVLNEIDKAIKY